MRRPHAAVLAWFLPLIGCAKNPTQGGVTPSAVDGIALGRVIAQVEAALKQYQDQDSVAVLKVLPPLKTAQFDFTAAAAQVSGGTFSFLIFKIGTSHERDVVNEVTFTYAPPPPSRGAHITETPPNLTDALVSMIKGAAKALSVAETAAGLPFSNLAITLQYGVKWEGKASADVPISFVTVGLDAAKKKNTVQSVKLVFAK